MFTGNTDSSKNHLILNLKGYDLIIERLIQVGYPRQLLKYAYDSSFVTRGLLFDRNYGNLLKIDGFGNVLVCYHGFEPVSVDRLRACYPNKFVNKVSISLGPNLDLITEKYRYP